VQAGDYYFLQYADSNLLNAPLVRNYAINSDEELIRYNSCIVNKDEKYVKAKYSYTGFSTPFYLKELLPILQGTDYDICLMSQFNAKDLMQYNIIFVEVSTRHYFFYNICIN